jgi:hypothetical protein
MIGTWAEDGIGCEECHGPGSDHIQQPSKQNIKIDSSSESCGKCHQRGGINPRPPASGGFIRHHEQINELLAGAHSDLSCIECHDPHKRAIHAKNNCAGCHEDAAASYAKNIHAKDGIKCFACHMPKMSKSAIEVNKYTGDVRSHIFKISTNPRAGAFAITEKEGKKRKYAAGLVTLEFSCLGCHLGRDVNWASMEAKKIHRGSIIKNFQ